MNAGPILHKLKEKFQDLIIIDHDLPAPHIGKNKIRAIILGADPTHIVDGSPQKFNKVFDLDDEKTPYWRSIHKNLSLIKGLSLETIHVDNLCKNYFSKETSQNKHWVEIAREYWAPFHRNELNRLYAKNIPVLITTEFILFAILINQKKKIKAENVYNQKILFDSYTNLFDRNVIAFYRHFKYALSEWPAYAKFISDNVPN